VICEFRRKPPQWWWNRIPDNPVLGLLVPVKDVVVWKPLYSCGLSNGKSSLLGWMEEISWGTKSRVYGAARPIPCQSPELAIKRTSQIDSAFDTPQVPFPNQTIHKSVKANTECRL
jgi:hypothetical protein